MEGKRVLYIAEKMNKDQYRVRIRKPQYDDKEEFEFDEKTKTITWSKENRFVLSHEAGAIKKGSALVMRPFGGKDDQRWFFKAKNFYNTLDKTFCTDVAGAKD